VKSLLVIGMGGFLGAVSRHLLSKSLGYWLGAGFPWGTFGVNLLGCLLIGFVLGLADRGNYLSQASVQFLAVGFCGGFTTFSSFASETNALFSGEKFLTTTAYVALSVLLGWLLVVFGIWLSKQV
jgi:CrcB protein